MSFQMNKFLKMMLFTTKLGEKVFKKCYHGNINVFVTSLTYTCNISERVTDRHTQILISVKPEGPYSHLPMGL